MLATIFTIREGVKVVLKRYFSIHFVSTFRRGRGEKLSETDKVKGGLMLV